MIRKFRENDLPSIMQIWFDSNVEVHSFIPEKYWMDNFEMVKDIPLNFNDNATTIIIEKYNSKSNSKTLFMNIMNNV